MLSKNTIFLIILAGVFGGSVYPIIKLAESYNVSALAYIFWESLFVVIILSVIYFLRGYRYFPKYNERYYYLFCAFTNILIPQMLFFLIAPNLSATIVGLIIITTPLFVYLGLLYLKQSSFSSSKFIGVIIGLIGASLLFVPNFNFYADGIDLYWVGLAFLLPLNYAINRIGVSRFKPENSPSAQLAIGLFFTVAILCGISMIASETYYIPFLNFNIGDLAIVLHALVMVGFYTIFFILAEKGALQNSLSSYVVPLVTLVWGVLLFDESIGILYVLSAVLIMMGLHFTNRNYKN